MLKRLQSALVLATLFMSPVLAADVISVYGGDADGATKVEAKVGDRVKLTLTSSGGIPYVWVYETTNPSILAFNAETSPPTDNIEDVRDRFALFEDALPDVPAPTQAAPKPEAPAEAMAETPEGGMITGGPIDYDFVFDVKAAGCAAAILRLASISGEGVAVTYGLTVCGT